MATPVGGESAQRFLRFTDVVEESCKMLMPISGYEDEPLVSLENAVKPLVPFLSAIQSYAYSAKERCKKPPADGLTIDESASIMLYTMGWKPSDKCLYFALNAALRTEDREKLVPWFPYLKLFLTALNRLPSISGTVYRGVKLDLSVRYQPGEKLVWWGFSSCSVSIEVLQSELFLGKTGARTIFNIESNSSKDIQNHSYYPSEKERLLLAARQFQVIGSLDLHNGLHMIHLKEIKPLFPLIHLVPVPPAPPLPITNSNELSTQPVLFLPPTGPMFPPIVQSPETNSYRNLRLEKKIQECQERSLVSLEKQDLIDKDMEIVVKQAIINKQCKQLRLNYNKITSAGALILSEALKNNKILEELELQCNQVSDQGVSFFANALSVNNNTLKSLVFGNNGITDEGVGHLAHMLRSNGTLTFLALSDNKITHQGLQSLVDVILNYNKTLRTLILTGNELLTDASGNALLHLIKQSQSLTYLDVNSCRLSKSVKTQLNQAGLARTGLRVET